MHCAGCAASVEKLLAAVPGAGGAQVNFATARARLPGSVPFSAIEAALARGGYALGTRTTRLATPAPALGDALERLDGVRSVRREDDGWVVEHVDAPDVLEALRDLVAPLGDAGVDTERDPEAAWRDREIRSWRWRFL